MTKFKSLLLTTAMLLCSLSASAHDCEVDGIYYNLNETNQTASVTYKGSSYNSYSNEYSGEVVIPESFSYNGMKYSVTSIGESAFKRCTSLSSITIPNSVTSIGGSAFYNCSGLSSITIPNSVTSIGGSAFNNCSGLSSITIPNSVTTIGVYTFEGCSSLSSITIPNSVTSIGESAFYGCSSLSSITIPNSVTSIGESAFERCTSLSSITIPNGVTEIQYLSFASCTSLSNITIGSGVLSINKYAFNEVSPTKVIWMPTTPPSGYSYINGKINYVPNDQYEDLDNMLEYPYLNELIEENGIKYIPLNLSERACGIIDLGQEAIEKEVTINGKATFRGIEMKANEVLPYAFYGYKDLKEVILPEATQKLGNYAFEGCEKLKSITLGSKTNIIGKEAFARCENITKITCYATTPPLCGPKALEAIDKWDCELIVPTGCTAAYQAADQWKDFFFLSETGIEDIQSAPTAPVDVYDLSGNKVKSQVAPEDALRDLPSGLYIINGKKIIVK